MSFRRINDDILRGLEAPGLAYFAGVGLALAALLWGLYAFWYQVQVGLGVAGYQPPILWAVYITNFVFWVGITHSGTLVSAVLYLCRARWRTGIARASEAMTVFAIMAGLLPIMWSHGTGAEVMQRIAVPMIGGMVSSTLLTLIVIPAIYAVVKSVAMQSPHLVPSLQQT